jgi:hypothetical protein
MKSSDYGKLTRLYEDMSAGVSGGQNSDIVMGVNMPDSGIQNQHEHETTKPQIVAFTREIKQILLDLTKAHLNPAIASKLATVTDRINSIDDWLQNNIAK